MANIKYVDIADWQKFGGLQEANRLFFHPHGWALEVTRITGEGWDEPSPAMEKRVKSLADFLSTYKSTRLVTSQYDNDTLLAKEILSFLHPNGSVHLSGIWDASDDPEGIVFGDWPEEYVEKAKAVYERRQERVETRFQLFGSRLGRHWPQPPGDENEADVEQFDYVWKGSED